MNLDKGRGTLLSITRRATIPPFSWQAAQQYRSSTHLRVTQDPCILQPRGRPCNAILGRNIQPSKSTTVLPITSNMPATTVEEWLESDRTDEPPHRCRKIVREWTTEDGAFVTCCADDGTQQTHKLVAMSSLSRRACYKCGNVGHYAEVCSSSERLCYNCEWRTRAFYES